MAISRAQMEEQIRGFANGGGAVGQLYDQEDPFSPDISGLDEIIAGVDPIAPGAGVPASPAPSSSDPINSEIAMLQQLMASRPSYDENVAKYQERLSATQPPSQAPSFYELMSDLGAAISAAPADMGAFTASAGGFKTFSDRIRANAAEEKKYRQQIALEAAKMAMEDERKAEQKLQDFAMEAYLNAAKEQGEKTDLVTLQYDEMDAEGKFTGRRIQRSFDKSTQRKQIGNILRTQNGIDVEALPDAPGETEGDKAAWKDLIADGTRINDAATKAYGKQDTIFNAKAIASQLGPDGFGRADEFLVGFRGFLADVAPWSMSDEDFAKLSRQEALAALTIDFTMANVAATKGAVSDKEMSLFKSAAPFLGQTYEGFMLALQIQEQAAVKQTEYADRYNDEYTKYTSDNPSATGREAKAHMDTWSRAWQRGEQSRFLSEQQIEQIKEYEKDAKDRGIKTSYSIDTAQRRQRAYAEKRQAEESGATDQDLNSMPLISPSLLAALPQETQEFINTVMSDPELSDDQKTDLISKAMRGES